MCAFAYTCKHDGPFCLQGLTFLCTLRHALAQCLHIRAQFIFGN